MARVALALCLLLALAAAAPSDFAMSEEELEAGPEAEEELEGAALAEEQRAGQEAGPRALDEEQWQGEDVDAAVSSEDQLGDEAAQEEYQQRDNAEQLTQQVQDTQVVQDSDEGARGRLRSEVQGEQQRDQQRDQQRGQLQQQDQQQGRQSDRQRNPPQDQPANKPIDDDFGLVSNSGSVRPPQPGTSQYNPSGYPPQRPPRPSTPPAGYSQLGSFGYFKVFLTPLTWPEALMSCVADGALLAVPSSEREALDVGQFYSKVKNQVKKSTDKDLFFIGASDLHKENSFVTLIGTKFGQGQWHRWQKGEPNNHKKVEHCVLSNEKAYYWDGNCQSKYAFVCQFKDMCTPGSPRYDEVQQSANIQQQTQSKALY